MSATNPEKVDFFYAPSALAANAQQPNLSGMRPMHACARCVLRPQPTYRACVHGRNRAQPTGRTSAFAFACGNCTHRARLAPEWTQSRTRGASRATCPCSRHSPPQCEPRCVPARPAALRQHRRIARSATRTSCRGCVGLRRRARSVQCCVRVMAWHGLQAEGGARVDDAGGRTSANAASYSASVLHCCASWRGVRLRRFGPIRCAAPSATLWAAQRYP